MDNPRFTNMNIPKFIQILDAQLASRIIRKYGEAIWYVSVLFRFLQFCLFFVGDSPKVSINQMPPALSSSPPTPKHTETTEISQKPVLFLAQSQRQSPRLWTATIPAIFPKGQLKYKALSFSFWFYIFQFGHGLQQSSVQAFKATVLVLCFAFMIFI